MDDLAWLTLQLEWGADEALLDSPVDRRATLTGPSVQVAPRPAIVPAAAAPAASGGPALVQQARALADAAATPDALRAALMGFGGFALRTTATNLVFQDGDPASRLVLVADVPGPDEDRSGRPLSGPAGDFLDRMLASAGLDRGKWQATCLVPWRPPGGRKPADAEVEACLPFLQRHLTLIRPRVAVLLGTLVARALLPANPRRARATWSTLTLPGAPDVMVLTMPAPAHVQTMAAAKRDSWAALLELRRRLDAMDDVHN